jgi:hypothetical protein
VRYTCTAAFLEIYYEVITDLLEPAATKLEIRESQRSGCYVEGLSSHTVLTGALAAGGGRPAAAARSSGAAASALPVQQRRAARRGRAGARLGSLTGVRAAAPRPAPDPPPPPPPCRGPQWRTCSS